MFRLRQSWSSVAICRQYATNGSKSSADKTHQADGYGMAEDWRETGRAVRDRTTEIVKETAKASRDAVKAATAPSNPDSDPAKQVPPESVNSTDAASTIADMTNAVKRAGRTAMDKVKSVYERVESIPHQDVPSADMPSDSPSSTTAKQKQIEIKDEKTRAAFEKGQQLQQEREQINGQ